jgi:hypothetical protein
MLLPGIAVLMALLNLRSAYIPAWKTDFRTPIEIASHQLGPRDALVIVGHDPIADGIMYAACQQYLPQMPGTSAVLTAPPTPEVIARLHACPHVLVICMWPDQLSGWLGFKVKDRTSFPYFADLVVGEYR